MEKYKSKAYYGICLNCGSEIVGFYAVKTKQQRR